MKTKNLFLLMCNFLFLEGVIYAQQNVPMLANGKKISYKTVRNAPSHFFDVPAIVLNEEHTKRSEQNLSNGKINAAFDITKFAEWNETAFTSVEVADNTIAISGSITSSNVIVSVKNEAIAYYDITGTLLGQSPLKYLVTGVPLNYSYHDPKVRYDPLYDRYVLSFMGLDGTQTHSMLLVLASKTNNPLQGWYGFAYDEDALFGDPQISDIQQIDRRDLAMSDQEIYIAY